MHGGEPSSSQITLSLRSAQFHCANTHKKCKSECGRSWKRVLQFETQRHKCYTFNNIHFVQAYVSNFVMVRDGLTFGHNLITLISVKIDHFSDI